MKPQVAFALALTLSFTGIVGNHAEAARSKPDLIVSAVSAPSPASPNATIVVSGTVKNQGRASAKAFGVAYYLSTSPSSTTGAAMLGTGKVSSLAAGASVVLATSFTVPGSTASGTFYVVAVADSAKVISESNESNNSRASGAVAVQPAVSTQPSAQMTVWVADSLTRVQPTDPPGTSTAATIKAARNEYEAFQVIIQAPISQALSNVNVVASDLAGPSVISKSNIVLYREHYIQVTTPSPRSPYSAGWWPDALIPFVNPETGQPLGGRFSAAPFPVPAGENQPIWIDVLVPTGTPAGTYHGQLTVTADGFAAFNVPLTLTVWNFTLPVTPSFQSDFGGFRYIANQHSVTYGSSAYTTIAGRYESALLAHRIMPGQPVAGTPKVLSDGSIDTTGATPVLQGLLARGLNSYELPLWSDWPFPDPLGVDRAKTQRYIKELMNWLDGLNLADRTQYYAVDEPNSASTYQEIRDLSTLAREADPRVKVQVTVQPVPPDSTWGTLIGSVNTWVPLFKHLDDPSIAERLAAGDKVWSYTALTDQGASTLPHWALDYPMINYRVPFWLNARMNFSGLLYWTTVYWNAVTDPWTQANTYPQDGNAFNGEGSLFYPGAAVGYDGPVTSMRLKALRAGAQDYEYFTLLARNGESTAAQNLLGQVVNTWTDWSSNPADFAAIRLQAATLLESLGVN